MSRTAFSSQTSKGLSESPRSTSEYIDITSSTFSCDIAYSDSPAASRALARLANHS